MTMIEDVLAQLTNKGIIMNITEIRVSLTNDSAVKAYVNIVFDNCFVIRGLKIIQGKKLFVAMPSRKRPDGTHSDIAYPINNETRINLEQQILEAYENELQKNLQID